MVIKEHHKRVKNPHKAEGFMLLEAVALVGFVALVGIEITSLHGLIMNAYHETDIRMHALSYAEDGMASTLTGISNVPVARNFNQATRAVRLTANNQSLAGDFATAHDVSSHDVSSHDMSSSQKNTLFKSEITKTRGVSFLPIQKPFTIVTVKVSWREQGLEKNIELTRLVTDDQVSL
jgi:hypothetical protein